MIYTSALATTASGSVGGVTASRNRGGQYFRRRAIPVNPNTEQQATMRSIMQQLTAKWVSSLTPAQRNAWSLYAKDTPTTNALGNQINAGGLGMFIRGNAARLQAGLDWFPDAPIVNDFGPFTPFTPGAADASLGSVAFTIDNTDEWANDEMGFAAIFVGRPQNASVVYYGGPWQFAGIIQGNSTTAPLNSQSKASPFPFAAGQAIFWRYRVMQPDSRYSSPIQHRVIAVP